MILEEAVEWVHVTNYQIVDVPVHGPQEEEVAEDKERVQPRPRPSSHICHLNIVETYLY
jgi:hypothetical protein